MPSLGVVNLSRPLTRGMRRSYEVLSVFSYIANSRSYRRFRHIPTFGNGVIRKFSNNTSEMKRLAARDFEDILQVCGSCDFYVRLTKMFLVCHSGLRRALSR
jgi:hypothetical protein